MQIHTMIEIVNRSRSIALERSVNIFTWRMGRCACVCVCGGGGVGGEGRGDGVNRFYEVTTLAMSSAVIYTNLQHLREHKNQTNTETKQR